MPRKLYDYLMLLPGFAYLVLLFTHWLGLWR